MKLNIFIPIVAMCAATSARAQTTIPNLGVQLAGDIVLNFYSAPLTSTQYLLHQDSTQDGVLITDSLDLGQAGMPKVWNNDGTLFFDHTNHTLGVNISSILGILPAGPTGLTGAKGDKGDTGSSGTNGSTGATGSTGSAGIAGTNGINGTNGTVVQATTVTANSSGIATWTFPSAYSTAPHCTCTVVSSSSTVSYNAQYTATATTCIVQLNAVSTVLGVLVLNNATVAVPVTILAVP